MKNPDSEEAQKMIAEDIRRKNVQQAKEIAYDTMPEAFISVPMLYVPIEINGQQVKAFVDSGAQITLMSRRLAERCDLIRLLDTDFAGIMRGVGTARSLGKIHMAQMKIGGSYFPVSLTVMEDNSIDFLLGLDMLRRHQCCIDLGSNSLRIMGAGDSFEEVGFLPENEIPQSFFNDPSSSSSSSSSSSAPVPEGKSEELEEEAKDEELPVSLEPANSREEMAVREFCLFLPSSFMILFLSIQIQMVLGFGITASREEILQTLRENGGDMDLTITLLSSR